jgi:DNA-binding PadR family transcriptional regulator
VFRSTTHDPHDLRPHHREPHRGPGPDDRAFGFRGRFGRDGFGRDGMGRGGMRRGEIRPLILAVLARKPMHGYEVIQALEAQSGGRWRPSAGSVYPTLQQLADEGLVTSQEVDGRRTYTLTDAGRDAAASNPAPRPWTDAAADGEPDLMQLFRPLAAAVAQVDRMGSVHARAEATRILADTRRQLYRLLADDEVDAAPGGEADVP